MKRFFSGSLLVALIFGIGYLSRTLHVGAIETQGKGQSATQLNNAKQIFNEKCAKCHGADGRGKTVMGGMLNAPDFTDKSWWKTDVGDERLTESIRNGKGGMPKFAKKLTGRQIAMLVAYVRRFDKSSR
jgi:mono/diheme cytochrome c family protein